MKIKAKNERVASMKLIVPVDGEISIDAKGVAEVSPKCATMLVKGTNDWDYVKKTPVVEDDEIEDDEVEDDEVEKLPFREEFELKLKSMKLEEMKVIAKDGKLPEEEWKNLTSKKMMSDYLLKKLDEAGDEFEGDEAEE